MVHEMIRRGYCIDEIVYCDTTIEFPDMYLHHDLLRENLQALGYDLTVLRHDHDFEYYMFDYVKSRGKNVGQCGLGWANPNYNGAANF